MTNNIFNTINCKLVLYDIWMARPLKIMLVMKCHWVLKKILTNLFCFHILKSTSFQVIYNLVSLRLYQYYFAWNHILQFMILAFAHFFLYFECVGCLVTWPPYPYTCVLLPVWTRCLQYQRMSLFNPTCTLLQRSQSILQRLHNSHLSTRMSCLMSTMEAEILYSLS